MRRDSALRIATLDNGLTVAIDEDRRTPIVTTVLWLRVGATMDPDQEAGAAHFLEHMMFKGSASFGAGEIDRLTQALGGSNNAFTGHDSTAYHFQFAADRWPRALEMEADRMAGLRMDAADFASERQVILEEIAMYESEPWEALETRVQRRLFGRHPYGRPVLGSREEVQSLTADTLLAFFERHYCPRNAVLIVAGDVGSDAEDLVATAFGSLPAGKASERPTVVADFPSSPGHVELHRGEVGRLLVALPAPSLGLSEHPPLRLLLHLLTVGRSSRLHRTLVEEEQLCAWVSGDLSDNLDAGSLSFALELLPGIDPRRLEERLFELLIEITESPVSGQELARAKQLYRADWVFGHEFIFQRALATGSALAHHTAEFPERYRRRVLDCDADDLQAAAVGYLDPEAGVVGWSVPEQADG